MDRFRIVVGTCFIEARTSPRLPLELGYVTVRCVHKPSQASFLAFSLACTSRSGYINKIVPIVGEGRGSHRATMYVNVGHISLGDPVCGASKKSSLPIPHMMVRALAGDIA